MNKRRAHRKSKGGCIECKRRHIKCDEGRPSCLHCVRHHMLCNYRQSPNRGRDQSLGEIPSPKSDTSWQILERVEFRHTSPNITCTFRDKQTELFDLGDLALLHHWATVVGPSILSSKDSNHYWHSVLPSIGFKTQYVMRSILSLSALHVAYTNTHDHENFLRIAAKHRSRAIDGFTEDLSLAGRHNSTALFANATLTFFYAFVTFSNPFSDNESGTKDGTSRALGAEWIPLLRGTAAVLEPVYHFVREGPLQSLLELHNFDELSLDENTHISGYGEQLMELRSLWVTDDHAGIYDETLRILWRCSVWMKQFEGMEEERKSEFGYNRSCSGPFIWTFTAPQDYFTLQQQRQPPALILFAYYGVLLHYIDGFWWSKNCGRRIVTAVDTCLGPYWGSSLTWPKQAVGLEPNCNSPSHRSL